MWSEVSIAVRSLILIYQNWVVNWWKSKDWVKNVFVIRLEKILETIYSTFFVFITCIFKPYLSCVYCCNIMCICLSNLDLLYFMCLLYYVCIAVLTLDAGLLASSQYPEGPATGHLDTGFSCFPSVYKRMLRCFPSFQVATTCLSCSPPDINFLVTFTHMARCFLWRQNNPEVNYSPTRISGGECF